MRLGCSLVQLSSAMASVSLTIQRTHSRRPFYTESQRVYLNTQELVLLYINDDVYDSTTVFE